MQWIAGLVLAVFVDMIERFVSGASLYVVLCVFMYYRFLLLLFSLYLKYW